MSRVLITGGTGFVGSWMQKTQPPELDCHYIGKAEYNEMKWRKNRYDYYVHLANISPSVVLDAVEWWCAKLLYCSSGIVYYPIETEYRKNKQRWEGYCVNSGVNHVIARLFTFFGNMTQPDKAITQFFECARQGKPLQVWGECTRSYMHGAEMGRQMWRILFEGKSGHAYDVGSTHKTTLLRLAQRISVFTGAKIERINARIPVPNYYPTGKNRIMD